MTLQLDPKRWGLTEPSDFHELLEAVEHVRRDCQQGLGLRKACDDHGVDFISFQRWCLRHHNQIWNHDDAWSAMLSEFERAPETLPGPYRKDSVFDRAESGTEIVIFDTEFTSWPGANENGWSAPNQFRELVQLGAVRFQLSDSYRELASFNVLVTPKVNPILSPYLEKLTGIANKDVERDGIYISEALLRFSRFCEGCDYILSNGGDGSVFRETLEIQRTDLASSLVGKEPHFLDANPFLREGFNLSRMGSMTERIAEIIGEDVARSHNACEDARTISKAFCSCFKHRQIES